MQIGKYTTCHGRLKMVNIKQIEYKMKNLSFLTCYNKRLHNIFFENSFCIDLVL